MSQIREKLALLLLKDEWSIEDQFWMLNVLESDDKEVLQELLNNEFVGKLNESIPSDNQSAKEILEQIHLKIENQVIEKRKPVRYLLKQLAIAASIFLVLTLGYFLFQYNLTNDLKRDNPAESISIISNLEDILPGSDKAILTLSDGSVVVLDAATEGSIATQSTVDIRKFDKGSLLYDATEITNELIYNVISTPRGGKFQITLSDGTIVWLNAASSLRFPVQFVGLERRVELSGEGYFEVAENTEKPFVVEVPGKQEVMVLGTHFNINSYADESSLNTTLLQGSVDVLKYGATVGRKLVPGQQYQIYSDGNVRLRNRVNLEATIAWKNDKFDFGESMELSMVMRQIERWYNVEVEYEGNVKGIELGGSISRNVKANKVFEMLELTGVANFRVRDGKVVISAKKY